jgi:hypothetical protein
MHWNKELSLKWLAALLLAAGFLRAAHFDWGLIRFPYVLGNREISEVYTVHLVSHGINPYTMGQVPLAAQLYGIGQALICTPLAWLHGNADLFLLRLVNGLFLLASAGLIYAWARLSSPRLVAASAALLCYSLWMAQIIPTCKPDAPALFFFLLGLYVPARRDYDRRSLALALCCGLAAYYTKPYFLLGAILLGPVLWMKRGLKVAVLYTLAFLGAFAAAAVAAWLCMPLYHYETFFNFFDNYVPNMDWAFFQLGFLETMLCGMAALPFLVLWRLFRKRSLGAPGRGLAEAELCFVLMAYLIPFRMSVHDGVFLTYMLELLAPFVVLMALAIFNRCGSHWVTACLVLGVCTVVTGNAVLRPEVYDLPERNAIWKSADSLLDPSKKTLVGGPMAALAYAKGMPICNTGSTEYLGRSKDSAWNNSMPAMREMGQRAKDYTDGIKAQILAGAYDRLVLSDDYLYYPDAMAKHYKPVALFTFNFQQTVGIYRTGVFDKVR